MDEMTEFQAILQEYGEDVKKLEKVKRPMDGLFGLGKSPAMDSCHERMDQRLEALVKRACGLEEGEAGADPRTADALAGALLRADKEAELPQYAHLALTAAQRHCLPLISRMSAQGKKELCAWFEKAYPRYARFPVQKDILKALKKG